MTVTGLSNNYEAVIAANGGDFSAYVKVSSVAGAVTSDRVWYGAKSRSGVSSMRLYVRPLRGSLSKGGTSDHQLRSLIRLFLSCVLTYMRPRDTCVCCTLYTI